MSAGHTAASAPRFALSTSVIGDAAVGLAVTGKLDATTTGQFQAVLRGVLAKPGLARLVLDFAALRLLDAGSVAALETAQRIAQRRGVTLTAANCHGTVRQALDTAGLYRHLVRDGDTAGPAASRAAAAPGPHQGPE